MMAVQLSIRVDRLLLMSYAEQGFNFPCERGFFGSEHGKGESDGITSHVKSKIDIAVLGEKAVI